MPTLFFVGGKIVVGLSALDQIQELAERIIRSEGMELIDLEFKPGQSRSLLRIFVDKEGGVTLDDCENVSRQIGAILDVRDLVSNAYVLEVSSPGIDRPFKTDRDYQRALGKQIKVYFSDDVGQSANLIGKLKGFNDLEIEIEVNGGIQRIAREVIRKAHQEIDWGHPRKNRVMRK